MSREIQKAVQKQFGLTAQGYVDSRDHRSQEDLALLLEWGAFESGHTVLDVATGGGHAALAVVRRVRRVVALDLTGPMLRAARGHFLETGARIALVQGEAGALPFGDGVFDRVICRIAPHHFPDVRAFLSETRRVLRSEGRLLLIDSVAPEEAESAHFLNELESRRDRSHVESHPVSRWMAWMEAAGLELRAHRLLRKRHGFEEWTRRAGMDGPSSRALGKWMLEQPEPIRRRFEVERDGDAVLSYTDDKWAASARRR